ncbi:MAG: radical SAM protein [Candidatus Omnitrophota bacterium]
MKSILFINPTNSDKIRAPDYFLMPLSLLYLAGTSKLVATTSILDLSVRKKKFLLSKNIGEFSYTDVVKEEIRRLMPDFVGVTCLFSGQFDMVQKIVDAVKEISPSAIIILGGMHPTVFHKDILLNCPNVDVIVIGEGEETLKKILTTDRDNWDSIEGLAFKNKQKQVIISNKSSFIKDLDELSPAYDMFNFEDYKLDSSDWYNPKKLNIGTSVPILTSRSCPFRCNFCNNNLVMGPSFRARSAEKVFQEIEYLYRTHDVRYFSILDDNCTLDKERIKKICKYIIDSKMDISFDMSNGIMPATLDDDVIDLLIKAGFVYCNLAIESGSDFIRNKVMNKQVSNEKIFRVVNSFRRYPNFHLASFFILGMPEETKTSLDETYKLIEALDIDSFKMAIATPFPGTKLFEQCQRDNLFLTRPEEGGALWRKTDWYQHILNEATGFFYKPYDMEVRELQEYVLKFEVLRHKKHLVCCQKGRQTLSVTRAMKDFLRDHPDFE